MPHNPVYGNIENTLTMHCLFLDRGCSPTHKASASDMVALTLFKSAGGIVSRKKIVRAVKGKIVERIVIDNDDYMEVDIQFQDSTSIGIQISSKLVAERVDLLGWKKGNSRVLRKL